MPPEWDAHERTWMAFPPAGPTTDDLDDEGLRLVRAAWAAVADAVVRFEPVTMLVDPRDVETARAMLDDRVELMVAALDDAWMRDIGPTFVHDETGEVHAVDWVFNGWGAQSWAAWEHDSLVASQVAGRADAPVLHSPS